MTREELEMFLEEIGAIYEVDLSCKDKGVEFVYIHGKDEYLKKKNHPRKYKNLFIPYLRVSWHDGEDRVYTRHNGLTGYMNTDDVKNVCRELTEIES